MNEPLKALILCAAAVWVMVAVLFMLMAYRATEPMVDATPSEQPPANINTFNPQKTASHGSRTE